MDQWREALLRRDTSAVLACYDGDNLVVRDSGGERMGYDALRTALSLTTADSIIGMSVPPVLRSLPGERCTTAAHLQAGDRKVYVTTVWQVPLSGIPYIARHAIEGTVRR
jgi:hypothetical protein